MKIIHRQLVEDALDRAGVVPDVVIHESYSGRGMYGERCFGVTGSPGMMARFMAELATLEFRADPSADRAKWATELADSLCTDSMGHDTIFYFPDVKISEW